MPDPELKLLRHPLQDILAAHSPKIPLHLAVVRRSWDDAVELELQLDAAQQALERCAEGNPLLVVVSAACLTPDTSFGLTQALVDCLAAQTFRRSQAPVMVVRLQLEPLEWAQQAVRRQLRGELPPPGLPAPCLHPVVLAQHLLQLPFRAGSVHTPQPSGEDAPRVGLAEFLGYYHSCVS